MPSVGRQGVPSLWRTRLFDPDGGSPSLRHPPEGLHERPLEGILDSQVAACAHSLARALGVAEYSRLPEKNGQRIDAWNYFASDSEMPVRAFIRDPIYHVLEYNNL